MEWRRPLERFRGSSNVPLSPQGLAQAKALGRAFFAAGGLDHVYASDLDRSVDTAQAIAKASKTKMVKEKSLRPWHLGQLEGQPVSPELIREQNALIRDTPDKAAPGKSPESGDAGESFNSFKHRVLKFVGGLIERNGHKQGIVTHYRTIRLVQAWLAQGAPPDGAIDDAVMTTRFGEPGDVYTLEHGGKTLKRIGIAGKLRPGPLRQGLYFVRHGKTGWNS